MTDIQGEFSCAYGLSKELTARPYASHAVSGVDLGF